MRPPGTDRRRSSRARFAPKVFTTPSRTMTGGGGGIGATVLLASLVIVVTHEVSARSRPPLRSARHGDPDGTVERVYVLGIDPGLSRCGYGIVHQQAAGVRATAVDALRTAPTLPTAQRLAELQSDLRALLEEHRWDSR